LVKNIKPNFKTIGPKYGRHMKAIAALIAQWDNTDIGNLEEKEEWEGEVNGEVIKLVIDDFVIATQDIPGWLVAVDNQLTVALDISLSDELKQEGVTRELINRIQNLRKESGLNVTDRINISFSGNETIQASILSFKDYLKSEVLANDISFTESKLANASTFELDEGEVSIKIEKQ